MKGTLYSLIFASLVVVSCSSKKPMPVPPGHIPNDLRGKTAVIIGNSITFGIHASDNAHRWSTLFCVAAGATEDNQGVSGRTMQGTGCVAEFTNSIIPVYNASAHGVLMIALGVNDIGQNNGVSNPASFETKYMAAIDYATGTRGWPKTRIVLLTPFWITGYTEWVGTCGVSTPADDTRREDYAQRVRNVARAKGVYLIDIYVAMRDSPDNDDFLVSDGVHPNDTGMAFISGYVKSQFQ